MPDLTSESHRFLRHELPARTEELQERLDLMHRLMPAGFKDWPRDAAEAMRGLAKDGLVEEVLGEWRWCSVKARKEPQKELFA
jgi:hypothetical protein